MPFPTPVKTSNFSAARIRTAPAARVFNACSPSRREKLEKQWLALAEGPFNGYGYKHEEWPAFEALLKAGADINARNKDGNTAFNMLCTHGNREAALKLLEAGCDAHTPNNAGMTPFLSAVHAGEPVLVRTLLVKGADLQSRDAQGKNAVDILLSYIPPHIEADAAHRAKRCEILELLVGAGLALNKYHEGRIYRAMDYLLPAVPALQAVHALSKAVKFSDHDAAAKLLTAGVHPDAPAAYGDNAPLSNAARGGDLPLMEALLTAGADINLLSGDSKITALHWSFVAGQKDSFTHLLSAGADPDVCFGSYGFQQMLAKPRDSREAEYFAFYSEALSRAGMSPEAASRSTAGAEGAQSPQKRPLGRAKISIHFSL